MIKQKMTRTGLFKGLKKCLLYLLIIVPIIIGAIILSQAAPVSPDLPLPQIGINVGAATNPKEASTSIQILVLLTVLSIAPSILMMMTSFTRVIIVLSFLRNALGTQQMPPNQVLAGLALFLTLFIMNPVLTDIYDNAYKPYTDGTMIQSEAFSKASDTIKKFMLKQTQKKDLGLFISLSKEKPNVKEDELYKLPLNVVIPSFMVSELTTAFKMGFFIYIPFLVIDMVVASTLMSMGMMMVPPVMVSLPFKILLFIMVGGWNIITQTIVNSFVR